MKKIIKMFEKSNVLCNFNVLSCLLPLVDLTDIRICSVLCTFKILKDYEEGAVILWWKIQVDIH